MSYWVCDVCSKGILHKFCLQRHQIVHRRNPLDHKRVYLPVVDDAASYVSSDEEKAGEPSMPKRGGTDDLWDAIIDNIYEKMRDKLHKKKSELMRQDFDLTQKDTVQAVDETYNPVVNNSCCMYSNPMLKCTSA